MTASSDLYASVNLSAHGTTPQDYLRAAQELMDRETPDSHFEQLEEFRQKLDGEMRELALQQEQFARFYASQTRPVDGSETIAKSTQMRFLREAFDNALLTSVELRGRVQTLRDVKLAVAKAKTQALASTFSGATSQTWKDQLEGLERRVTTNYNAWLDCATNRCQILYANYVYIYERLGRPYAKYPLTSRLRDAVASWRSWLPENWNTSSANTDSDFIGSYLPIPKIIHEQLKKINSLDLDTLTLLRLRLLGVYYKAPKQKRGEFETQLKEIDQRIRLLKAVEEEQEKKKPLSKWSYEELAKVRSQLISKMGRDTDPEGEMKALLGKLDMHLAKHRAKDILSGTGKYPELIQKFLNDLQKYVEAHRFEEWNINTVLETAKAIVNCQSSRALSLSALYTAAKTLEALQKANGEDYIADLRAAAVRSFATIKDALRDSPPKTSRAVFNTLAALKRCHDYFGQSDFTYLKEVMESATSHLRGELDKRHIVLFEELQTWADLLKAAGQHFASGDTMLNTYLGLFVTALKKCTPERNRRVQQSFIQMLDSVAIHCGSHQKEIQAIADKYRGKLQ